MAASGSAVAVFVAGIAVGTLALARPAEPRVVYSKTVGTEVQFTGQGQVVGAGAVHIPCWGLLLALVLVVVAVAVAVAWIRRDRKKAAESDPSPRPSK